MKQGQAIAQNQRHERQRTGQSFSKILRGRLSQAWFLMTAPLASVSPVFMRLAERSIGPYKDRRKLRRYLGNRPYISPLAQIGCANLSIGPRCFIDDYVTIYSHSRARGHVALGENVHIYRWSMIELGDGDGGLEIGANTYIQAGCTLNPFLSSIFIGENCMIAPRCAFMPYQHGSADRSRPMREQPLMSRGDIVIEDDVWMGVNASVMDGVVIGRGSIIGAGAVVTHDIPPYSIAVGVPARVIRERQDDAPASEQPTSEQLEQVVLAQNARWAGERE